MRSRYANFIIALAALLAFVPLLASGYLLDNYVRQRGTARLQHAVDFLGAEIEASADDEVGALRRILSDSPSLCTPTFLANVRNEMQKSLHLRQALVENSSGVQYCDALGTQITYTPLSDTLPIPGHTETASVVKFDGLEMPVLAISQSVGAERRVSVFAPVLANAPDSLLPLLQPASLARVSLSSGVPVLTVGDATSYDSRRSDSEFIWAQSLTGEMPLRVEAAVPFSVVRASYAGLSIVIMILACAISAAILVMLLQYTRRSSLPAFDLERAIAHGELKPYYQPVIDLNTGRLIGCEMLCRWEKKNGELVPPAMFIDYAEQSGLAIPMTVSLMQQVRIDLSDLCRDMPDLKVSINLFEGHFRDSSIVDDVQAIFGGSPINFRQLVFELTERRPIGDSAVAHTVISGLHALGCRLAMDDIGTGHSNLAYLQTLGVDLIKIDRVFVEMVKPGVTQVPVLDGLIALAKDLGTDVVAEGVETPTQAFYLRERGVVMAQGFLFAPALKAKSFQELARALNRVHAPSAEALSDAA